MKSFFIYGAGGNGIENLDLIRHEAKRISKRNEIFFVESNPTRNSVNGFPLISESEMLKVSRKSSYLILTIADCFTRAKLVKRLLPFNFRYFNSISTNSIISSSASLGTGNLISHNTLISNNTIVGNFAQINYFSSISHDCTIGDFVTIGPGARVNGYTKIGSNVFIGSGALIKPGTATSPRLIGDNSVIGMGAVVLKDVQEGQIVVGNPAKLKKNKSNL